MPEQAFVGTQERLVMEAAAEGFRSTWKRAGVPRGGGDECCFEVALGASSVLPMRSGKDEASVRDIGHGADDEPRGVWGGGCMDERDADSGGYESFARAAANRCDDFRNEAAQAQTRTSSRRIPGDGATTSGSPRRSERLSRRRRARRCPAGRTATKGSEMSSAFSAGTSEAPAETIARSSSPRAIRSSSSSDQLSSSRTRTRGRACAVPSARRERAMPSRWVRRRAHRAASGDAYECISRSAASIAGSSVRACRARASPAGVRATYRGPRRPVHGHLLLEPGDLTRHGGLRRE